MTGRLNTRTAFFNPRYCFGVRTTNERGCDGYYSLNTDNRRMRLCYNPIEPRTNYDTWCDFTPSYVVCDTQEPSPPPPPPSPPSLPPAMPPPLTPVTELVVYGGVTGGTGNSDCDSSAERELEGNPNNCPQTWYHARDLCVAAGGFLALPRTVAELNELQALIASSSPGGLAWIGLNDLEQNTVWKGYWGESSVSRSFTWPNGARAASAPFGDYDVQFHSWAESNQPTTDASSNKNCAQQVSRSDGATFDGVVMTGRWYSRNCVQIKPYACAGVGHATATAARAYVFLPGPSPPVPPFAPPSPFPAAPPVVPASLPALPPPPPKEPPQGPPPLPALPPRGPPSPPSPPAGPPSVPPPEPPSPPMPPPIPPVAHSDCFNGPNNVDITYTAISGVLSHSAAFEACMEDPTCTAVVQVSESSTAYVTAKDVAATFGPDLITFFSKSSHLCLPPAAPPPAAPGRRSLLGMLGSVVFDRGARAVDTFDAEDRF